MDNPASSKAGEETRKAAPGIPGWIAWRLRALLRAAGISGALTIPLATLAALAAQAPDDRASAALGVLLVALGLLGVFGRFMLQPHPAVLTRWGLHRILLAVGAGAVLASAIWAMLLVRLPADWTAWPTSAGVLAVALGMILTLAPGVHWLPIGLGALATFLGVGWFALDAVPPDLAERRWQLVAVAAGAVLLLLAAGAWLSRWAGRMAAGFTQARAESRRLQGAQANAEQRLTFEIDHRRGVERELTLARDAAEGAMRAKTEFLATMSHEIRTPLNGILPILELLRDTRLDDEQREYVDTAYKSSRHLLRLINDVLDFAKVEAGKLELENIEINLHELIESVTDLMRRAAEYKDLALRVEIDAAAPETVRGDPIRLRQVLTNLVSNAVKFTEQGSVRVEVKRLRLGRKEVVLRFAVVDTGSGMAAETAQRLFQPFTQADASTTRKHGGSGLGLVICKRLVELMGGQIGVHSVPGEGSTFWFELPLRRSLKDAPSERRDLEGVRVLTLSGDAVERARISGMMRHWGMLEERAETAIEATGKLKTTAMLGDSWAFELVLVDARGQEPRVAALVREVRAERRLRALQFLIGVADPQRTGEFAVFPGVTVTDAPLQAEQVKRQLYRILDVDPGGVWAAPAETGPQGSRGTGRRAAARPAPATHGESASGHRVLLVEDNPINLTVARKLLQHLGLDCVGVQDGSEALAQLGGNHFDLVLMDVQMPVMDGYETTRRIRELAQLGAVPHVPVVAMTANAMQGDREACLAAGMDDYIPKPLDIGALKQTLERWLGPGSAQLRSGWGENDFEASELTELDEDASDLDLDNLREVETLADSVEPQALEPDAAPAVAPDTGDDAPAGLQPPTGEASGVTATARDATGSVLDHSVLEDLREVMEEEFVRLLRSFLQLAPGQVERMEAAARAGDIEAMARAAHSLKSSSANVGALQVSERARELEQDAREARRTAAVAALPALRAALDDAIAELEPILRQEESAGSLVGE